MELEKIISLSKRLHRPYKSLLHALVMADWTKVLLDHSTHKATQSSERKRGRLMKVVIEYDRADGELSLG
jgi:hypothetical protein